MEVFGIATVRR